MPKDNRLEANVVTSPYGIDLELSIRSASLLALIIGESTSVKVPEEIEHLAILERELYGIISGETFR